MDLFDQPEWFSRCNCCGVHHGSFQQLLKLNEKMALHTTYVEVLADLLRLEENMLTIPDADAKLRRKIGGHAFDELTAEYEEHRWQWWVKPSFLPTWLAESRVKDYGCRGVERYKAIDQAIGLMDKYRTVNRHVHVILDAYDAFAVRTPSVSASQAEKALMCCILLEALSSQKLTPEVLEKDYKVRELHEFVTARYNGTPTDMDRCRSCYKDARPNLHDYVWEVSNAAGSRGQRRLMALYFAELVQFSGGVDGCSMGMEACLCVFLARMTVMAQEDVGDIRQTAWPPLMEEKTGVSVRDMRLHMADMCEAVRPCDGFKNIKTKYGGKWEEHVSDVPLLCRLEVARLCEDHDVCKICMDAIINCVLLECGHMVTCTKCGQKMTACPICRQTVVRVMRIFKA